MPPVVEPIKPFYRGLVDPSIICLEIARHPCRHLPEELIAVAVIGRSGDQRFGEKVYHLGDGFITSLEGGYVRRGECLVCPNDMCVEGPAGSLGKLIRPRGINRPEDP